MIERIVFMQTEDNMVTFERDNGNTIIYPIYSVPAQYKEGDVIKVIVHNEDFIEFIELDEDEMAARRARVAGKRARLGKRARRNFKV